MANQTQDRVQLVDPRELYPGPPFKQKKIDLPGKTSQMTPRPDHGEETYRGSGKLQGLSALITGGDSGIGRAVAIAFAREGANVAINYLSESEDAAETKELIEQAGVKGLAIEGDLSNEAFCKKLIERVFDEFGSLEILVNNAAHQEVRQELDEFSTELFDQTFKTNVYPTFWLCREALSRMPAGSSIINTASIQGYAPSPQLLPYAASKSALLGITKGLAKLAIEHGVRVNAVAPGPVWTPLIPASLEADHVEKFGGNTLFKRPAQPAELAPLYVWLASPEASYVTAETFEATGGRTQV